jgi:Flp pilus assembly protein TadD
VYNYNGRHETAIASYKEAIRLRPDNPDAQYGLGVAYLATGNDGLAMEEYERLKKLDQKKADFLLQLILMQYAD